MSVVGEKLNGIWKLSSDTKDHLESRLEEEGKCTTNMIKEVLSEIISCKNELQSSKITKEEINTLRNKITDLESQKVMNLSAIGQKDAQYEELLNQYNTIKSNFEDNNKIIESLTSTNTASKKEIEANIHKITGLEENFKFQEASYKNKLQSQAELISTINTEKGELQTRIQKLEEERRAFEQNLYSKVDKIEELNNQVQNMNVEMVQLKAQKLELVEENNSIKLNVKSDQEHQLEAENELKLQKQKIILLTAKTQDLLTEKLELQDQIENLNSILKKAPVKKNNTPHINKHDETVKLKKDNVISSDKSKINGLSIGNANVKSTTSSRIKMETNKGNSLKTLIDQKINDIFDLSSSNSEPDLDNTSSSFLTNKLTTANVKGNNFKSKEHPNMKKKLIEDDDYPATKMVKKKKKINRVSYG
ncbi:Zip1p RNJ42_00829 [Nakaseomyces bracarensis]|uniref:Zip1p n=1 Tax=Nakaseomyces bracarensis TaxID=273131 RepID=UPI0038725F08